ncbi:MAG TPA: hypothetical protein VGR28_01435 [Candidatus Thermoplasmatota archaeon]|jgi:hypothetical protein|nr:hypothetical protein [Candidatus Thermoplasmatota archaeon]
MRTILIGALVLLGSLSVAGAASTPQATGENELGEIVTFDVPVEPDHSGSCVILPVCSTGSAIAPPSHVRTAGLTHGFQNYLGFTGSMVSVLVGEGSSPTVRLFACNVNAGAITCQGGQGTFPAIGQTFSHFCAAVGNYLAPPSCFIIH